jgi:hypothetical protein
MGQVYHRGREIGKKNFMYVASCHFLYIPSLCLSLYNETAGNFRFCYPVGGNILHIHQSSVSTPTKPKRWIKIRQWTARIILIFTIITGLFLATIPSGRAIWRAAMILPAIIAPDSPVPLNAAGASISHTSIDLVTNGTDAFLDVYEPTSSPPLIPGSRPGMLIIPGVGDNRLYPQMVNLASSLAKSGIIVMLTTTPTLLNYQLDPADEGPIVASFKKLTTWQGINSKQIGILSISAANAPASAAAANPTIREQVAYFISFGGHFDTLDLVRAVGKRAVPTDPPVPWDPAAVPLQVIANTVAPYLPNDDASILKQTFDGWINPPLTSDEIAALTPMGQNVYHLIEGDEPSQVDTLIEALPAALKIRLQELSPRTFIKDIHAPIYLLHDRTDRFVPVTESRHFASALAANKQKYSFAEFGIFQHAEVRQGTGPLDIIGDGFQLFKILISILEYGA